MVERALATPDATEIKTQRREAPVHEGVVQLVDDRVVHRPAELRVGMEDDCDRRVFLPRRVVSPLDATGGAGEDNLRHCFLTPNRLAPTGRGLGTYLWAG